VDAIAARVQAVLEETAMRVLITWGSKHGGTRDIARMVADVLRDGGHEVDLRPPEEAARAVGYDAAIVGGALYANRWHRAARRFVARQEKLLRSVPVWFFSSGPLDDSAEREVIPPTRQVKVLMERVGAQGHITFGGRLEPDVRGFPDRALAREHAGDWRNPARIRAWAKEVARALPGAAPGMAIDHPQRAWSRVLAHALVGWAICTVAWLVLLTTASVGIAVGLHALVAAGVFGAVARAYFRDPAGRDPLPVAASFALVGALLDGALVAGAVERSTQILAMPGFWLPFPLVLGVTWIVGGLMSTLPWPKPAKHGELADASR
jgi:menaquinone-dependent protoporphyrinogen oxidase